MSQPLINASLLFEVKATLDNLLSLLEEVLHLIMSGRVEFRDNIKTEDAKTLYIILKAKYRGQRLQLLKQEPYSTIIYADLEVHRIIDEIHRFFIIKEES